MFFLNTLTSVCVAVFSPGTQSPKDRARITAAHVKHTPAHHSAGGRKGRFLKGIKCFKELKMTLED